MLDEVGEGGLERRWYTETASGYVRGYEAAVSFCTALRSENWKGRVG